MTTCTIKECDGKARARQLCNRHYKKLLRLGDPLAGGTKRPNGTARTITKDGYVRIPHAGRTRLEHIVVAEQALGRSMPRGAIVHHVNGIPDDNRPQNLVICPDTAYHMLLHSRQEARDACGHLDWQKCSVCKGWDSADRIRTYKYEHSTLRMHPACSAAKAKAKREEMS